MCGRSLGGATAADAMAADERILVGIDRDGSIIVKDLPTRGDQTALSRSNASPAQPPRRSAVGSS
jgi:hypothetical protein